MIDLIREGGPLFTVPQTLLALIAIGLAAKGTLDLRRSDGTDTAGLRRRIGAVLQIGLFCLFLGVLSQTIGLVQALDVIRQVNDVAPPIVMQGFLVSLIAPLYGLAICLLCVGAWLSLKRRAASVA